MSQTRPLECSNCGAPLTRNGNATEVRCPYCGTLNIISEDPNRADPSDAYDDEVTMLVNWQSYRTDVQGRGGRDTLMWSFWVIVLLAAVIGGRVLWSYYGRASRRTLSGRQNLKGMAAPGNKLDESVPSRVPSRSDRHGRYIRASQYCLVDADGDEYPDLFGMETGRHARFFIISGATGKTMYRGEDAGSIQEIHCYDRHWIGALGPASAYAMVHITANSGMVNLIQTTFRVHDRLAFTGTGKKCIYMRFVTGGEAGLSIPSFGPTRCRPRTLRPAGPENRGLHVASSIGTTEVAGRWKYTLIPRGDRVLLKYARLAGRVRRSTGIRPSSLPRVRWSRKMTLDLIPDGNVIGMDSNGRELVIYGMGGNKRSTPVLTVLSHFSHRRPPKVRSAEAQLPAPASLQMFHVTGSRVILAFSDGRSACYDMDERKWLWRAAGGMLRM